MTITKLVDKRVAILAPPSSDRLEHSFQLGFARVRKEVEAFPEAQCIPINVDVVQATMVCLGAEPNWGPFLEKASILPEADAKAAENCVNFAHAAWWANLLFTGASSDIDEITALEAECQTFRNHFQNDLLGAVERGVIDGSRMALARGGNAQMNVSFDLGLYCTLIQQNWPVLKGRIMATDQEVRRAQIRAEELLRAVGYRESGSPELSEAGWTRRKAFSLFVNAYSQVRRLVTFERWNVGDAEAYAPSLFSGRAAPKKADDGTSDGGDSTAQGAVAPTAPAAPPAAVAPVAVTPAASPAASTTSVPLSLLGPSTPFSK